MPNAEVAKVFEPILRDILGFIQEQVRLAGPGVTAVLLVGGFGQSQYLRRRAQESVSASIAVMQPDNGWTAVVRGAVMLGIGRTSPAHAGVTITSRVARTRLSVKLSAPYDDDESDAGRV